MKEHFYLEKLTLEKPIISFACSIAEYNDYLLYDAIRSHKDHIAKTWLLCEHKTGKIAAYMSFPFTTKTASSQTPNSTTKNVKQSA